MNIGLPDYSRQRKDYINVHGPVDNRYGEANKGVVPLTFPPTRTALWDSRPAGSPSYLHISQYRHPVIVVEEKALRLAQRFAQDSSDDTYTCLLIGSVSTDPDGEGVHVTVDRLDPRGDQSNVNRQVPGEVYITCQVLKNHASTNTNTSHYFNLALQDLHNRCTSKDRIDVGQFMFLRATCGYRDNNNGFIFHIDVDMVIPSPVFKATPINSIPIVPTALSKNLSGPLSMSEVQGEPKSGYMTMDHTRKLLLILESDPKVATLPLVGIWVSGLAGVHCPFVWANCLRYVYSDQLKDRVCKPPEPFLVLLYSNVRSKPEFYQCSPEMGKADLAFNLHSCHEIVHLPKDIPGRPQSPLEIELPLVESGSKKDTFDAAIENSKHLFCRSRKGSGRSGPHGSMEDITPRSVPSPHYAKAPVVQSAVPEVSMLLDENDYYTAHPINTFKIPTIIPPKHKKDKKKKSSKKEEPTRGPLKPVNRQSSSLPVSPDIAGVGQYGGPPHRTQSDPIITHMYGPHTPYMQHGAGYAYGAQMQQQQQQQAMLHNTLPPTSNKHNVMGPSAGQYLPLGPTSQQYNPNGPPTNQHHPVRPLPSQHQIMGPPANQHHQTSPSANQPHPMGPTTNQHHPMGPQPNHHQPMGPQPNQHHQIQQTHPNQQHPMGPAINQYYSMGPSASHPDSIPGPLPPQQQQHPRMSHPHTSVQQQSGYPPSGYPANSPYYTSANGAPTVAAVAGQTWPGPAPPSQSPSYQHIPTSTPGMPHYSTNQPATAMAATSMQASIPGRVSTGQCIQGSGNRGTVDSLPQGGMMPPIDGAHSAPTSPTSAAINSKAINQSPQSSGQSNLNNSGCSQSVASISSSATVPPEVLALLEQQDAQLKLLREQLSLLMAKQDSPGNHMASAKESTTTATQMSNVSSPVKHRTDEARDMCSIAVNTSTWWQSGRDSEGHDTTIGSVPQPHYLNATMETVPAMTDKSVRDEVNSNVGGRPMIQTSSHASSPCSQTGGHRPTPSLGSVEPSPIRRTSDHGFTMSNETLGSFGEFQLTQIQDRTEESIVSNMVVDMPDYGSLSPEKSVLHNSSGYGDTDESNRSPVLGESVSMYQQMQETRGQDAGQDSADTGLGDSHQDQDLLFNNQKQFYKNLIGSVNKFLDKYSEDAGEGSVSSPPPPVRSPPPVRRSVSVPDHTDTTLHQPHTEIDIADQTREQLRKMGIDLDTLSDEDKTFFRGNNSTLFLDPSMLPKISYVSMMLDRDSDTSADADALSMKYLSDEQLAELAKLRQKSGRSGSRDVGLDRLLGSDSSTMGGNANYMSFSTKKYMERYGLLDESNSTNLKDSRGKDDESQLDTTYGTPGSRPGILDVQQFLEKLADNSLIIDSPNRNCGRNSEKVERHDVGRRGGEKRLDNGSVCSCGSSSHSSQQADQSQANSGDSFEGYRLPPTPSHHKHRSINSDTTQYRTPEQSPRRQRHPEARIHNRASSDHTPVRVFNKEFKERIKNYEDKNNKLAKDIHQADAKQDNKAAVVQPRRILDIERLKELPKLL